MLYYINKDSMLVEVTANEKDPVDLTEVVNVILENDEQLDDAVNIATIFAIYGIANKAILDKRHNKHNKVKNIESWQKLYEKIFHILSKTRIIRNTHFNDLGKANMRGYVINNAPMFHGKMKPITSREIGVTDIYRIVYGTKVFAEIKTEGLTTAQVLAEIDEKMYSVVKAIKDEQAFWNRRILNNNVVTLVSYKLNNFSGIANNLTMFELREYPFNYLLFSFDVCDKSSVEHVTEMQH